jgi:acyl dehydratase
MLDVDVVEARTSKSRPNLGIVKFKCTMRNARGEALCEMTSPILIERREGAV